MLFMPGKWEQALMPRKFTKRTLIPSSSTLPVAINECFQLHSAQGPIQVLDDDSSMPCPRDDERYLSNTSTRLDTNKQFGQRRNATGSTVFLFRRLECLDHKRSAGLERMNRVVSCAVVNSTLESLAREGSD
jgi:hypothetical protein